MNKKQKETLVIEYVKRFAVCIGGLAFFAFGNLLGV